MRSISFNPGSKIQISSSVIKHSKAKSAFLSGNSKNDSVSFTGKKETDKNNSSFAKQVLNAVVAAFGAAIAFLVGKISTKPDATTNVKPDASSETEIKNNFGAEAASGAEATSGAADTLKTEVAGPKMQAETLEAEEQTGVVADMPLETADGAQKEILELTGSAEKEIQDLGETIQKQAKEIHADALDRINKLVEIAKNNGKDADGKTVGKMKYNPDKNIYSLVLEKKDGDAIADSITLEIGTDKVLGALLRFEDGVRIDVNSDVMSYNKDKGNKIFYFDRNKGDELKAFMGHDASFGLTKTLDFKDGKVSEYSELDMRPRNDVSFPRHAIFLDGEMVRYYEYFRFKEEGETRNFTKGYVKTFGGTWDDLTQEK